MHNLKISGYLGLVLEDFDGDFLTFYTPIEFINIDYADYLLIIILI